MVEFYSARRVFNSNQIWKHQHNYSRKATPLACRLVEDFGLNKGSIDPRILSSISPLQSIQNLFEYRSNEGEMLCHFILNHFQWVVKVKSIIQIMNGQPFIAGKVYTKMWDTLNYEQRFLTHNEND